MTTPRAASRFGRTGAQDGRGFPFWLWLSLPIAVLAMTGSIIGIVLEDRIYGGERLIAHAPRLLLRPSERLTSRLLTGWGQWR